jgi:hypothetical protein
MTRSVWRALATVLALGGVLLAVGCSSDGTTTPGGSSTVYGSPPVASALAQAAIVECSIHAGLLTATELNAYHNLSQWYRDGRVIANHPFTYWWQHDMMDSVRGQTLDDWGIYAAQHQKLPAKVCPRSALPSPSPSG